MGKFLTAFLVLSALLAGGGIYYLQVYAFYETLPDQRVMPMTVAVQDGTVLMPIHDFMGIDADSSPIRYRACFSFDAAVEGLVPYEEATPLIAPGWFDCFDAEELTAAFAAGTATAYLSEAHFRYGFDRVVAIFADGRAVAWQQINPCGRAMFDGNPIPFGCPVPPEFES
jgi:hypothetical protein